MTSRGQYECKVRLGTVGVDKYPWRSYPASPQIQFLGRGHTILTSRELMWYYACSRDVRGDLTLNYMTQIHTSVTLLTSRDLTWSSGRLTRQHASHISVVAHISWGVTNVSSALHETDIHVPSGVRTRNPSKLAAAGIGHNGYHPKQITRNIPTSFIPCIICYNCGNANKCTVLHSMYSFF